MGDSIWPGYRPDTIPVLYLLRGHGTLLLGWRGALPPGFTPDSAAGGAGWQAAVDQGAANTAAELLGRGAAQVVVDTQSIASLVGLTAHEAFHVFERASRTEGRRFGRGENSFLVTSYPVFDPQNEAGMALEGRILAAAESASTKTEKRMWAREFSRGAGVAPARSRRRARGVRAARGAERGTRGVRAGARGAARRTAVGLSRSRGRRALAIGQTRRPAQAHGRRHALDPAALLRDRTRARRAAGRARRAGVEEATRESKSHDAGCARRRLRLPRHRAGTATPGRNAVRDGLAASERGFRRYRPARAAPQAGREYPRRARRAAHRHDRRTIAGTLRIRSAESAPSGAGRAPSHPLGGRVRGRCVSGDVQYARRAGSDCADGAGGGGGRLNSESHRERRRREGRVSPRLAARVQGRSLSRRTGVDG